MRNIIGSPMEPDDLFNQEEVIQTIWQRVEDQHVVLLAPRKFGKTSVLLHLQEKPREGWQTALVDVSYRQTPEDFVADLLAAIAARHAWVRKAWEKVKGLPNNIRQALDSLEVGVDAGEYGARLAAKLREVETQAWQTTADALLRELDAQTESRRLLVLIDELGKMVELMAQGDRVEDACALMNWFKSIRSGAATRLKNVRFVIASSIGIDRLVRQLGVPDAVEDLFPVYLDALPPARARELLEQLAASYRVTAEEGVWQRAVELLGQGVPEFIHMLFSELRDRPRPLTVETLESVYENELLGHRWRRSFQEYVDRFDRYGADTRKLLIDLLLTVAREGAATHEQLRQVYDTRRGDKADPVELSELLADLEADFYLRIREDRYEFVVSVLRDWILRFYGD